MDIADVMIHVHPDFAEDQRGKIETILGANEGVVSVHFSPDQRHDLTVAYDPKLVTSHHLLEQVREWDEAATMIGL
ncbi:MAG: hypothetical protein BMS9Abin15_0340 [Gammaproteobacteria bacterium]|nr:MAG: hypothetical protein BMS9Abin15_0340 [Gammaproteobacteria bacterium]